MKIKHIIFDLDGTLIDSAPSIIFTINKTLNIHKIKPIINLDYSIIGPPLHEIFSRVTGSQDSVLLESLIKTFKLQYDTVGYKDTSIFCGIRDTLKVLVQKNISIYIATNKRIDSTLLILEHFKWVALFKGVYSLDCVEPPYPNKSSMLAQVYRDINMDSKYIAYVGDKNDDGYAADANALPFFKASWGYDFKHNRRKEKNWKILEKPIDILQIVI